ncbi:M23 family metallopeptidase [Candidatus Daviesbacteria bacterium]|nr:M23 family metallopeptidase [Candidatus Daviesbacteria bacterium]
MRFTFDPEYASIQTYPKPSAKGFNLQRQKVIWLTIIFGIFFTLAGYYPTLSVPPTKRSAVLAQAQEQKGEIISTSFSKPLILPHPGYLTTRFSSYHPGIDIATGLGMPIHPIIVGVVTETGFDIFGLGNYVYISHEKGFKSKYAHMGRVFVKTGDKVSSEIILGEVGLTGNTSGPHTHLEITLEGQFIDPQKLLPEIPRI